MTDARHRLSAPKWLVLALLVALAPAVARADQSTERAKQLFSEGTTLFNIGEFDKAIEAWQDGYKEKPDPGFLYNIGQAYRLKGDNQKAIFFYRGYLRNSPKAANKAEVEAKIAQLQKAMEAKPGAPGTTAPTPAAPPPATPAPTPVKPAPLPPPPVPLTPPGPTPVAPPPVDAPPLTGPASAPPVLELPVPAPPERLRNRPLDLSVALGFDAWTSGVRAMKVEPSFAFDLAGGYTLGDVYGPSSFRLGARLCLTSLKDVGDNKVSFTSLLAEPTLRVRVVQNRVYLTGALGFGALFVSGIKETSALVVQPKPEPGKPPEFLSIPSTVTFFELRPAVGVQVHLSPGVVASVTPALSIAPKKPHFYENIGRFELMFGLSLLL